MSLLITILIVLASIFLIFFVVIQNSKGGGLAAGFSSSNQVMGVRKTTDFLEKTTWILAGIIVFLCIAASLVKERHVVDNSNIRDEIQNIVPGQSAVPNFGTAIPVETEGEADGETEIPAQ